MPRADCSTNRSGVLWRYWLAFHVVCVSHTTQMREPDPERWRELFALAAKEQDPDKLMMLVREIESLLGDKLERPNRSRGLQRCQCNKIMGQRRRLQSKLTKR